MQREDLQEATASAPLDEEAEYVMQQTWLIDEDSNEFLIAFRFLVHPYVFLTR